jgi:hypothetical protein
MLHVVNGDINKTIAHKLGIGENTVKVHIRHILNKMGVNNRTKAALIYKGDLDMKGPQFNARVASANKKTDQQLARIAAALRQEGDVLHEQAVRQVLRPYSHMVNLAQEENTNPVDLLEVARALSASMMVEIMFRTVPKGTPGVIIQGYLAQYLEDLTALMVDMINTEYKVGLTVAPLPAQDAGTVQ